MLTTIFSFGEYFLIPLLSMDYTTPWKKTKTSHMAAFEELIFFFFFSVSALSTMSCVWKMLK